LVNQNFVPVALKAALVNNPPAGIEGAFIREISRSKPAPQGICVANSSGKALAWVLGFDNNAQVPRFLDHCLSRNKEIDSSKATVPTERFRLFPSRPLPTATDINAKLPPLVMHGKNEYCVATPEKEQGTLVAKVWGRRLDKDKVPLKNCVLQENYIEDVFDISNLLQQEVAVLAKKNKSFRLPESFVKQVVSYAYLGQLDVRPVYSPVPEARSKEHHLELWAEPSIMKGKGRRWIIKGKSDVETSRLTPENGAQSHHRISLNWEGYIDLSGENIAQLGLWATGQEQLQWGNRNLQLIKEPAVTHLMAGRYINVDSPVRYGIIGKPVIKKQK